MTRRADRCIYRKMTRCGIRYRVSIWRRSGVVHVGTFKSLKSAQAARANAESTLPPPAKPWDGYVKQTPEQLNAKAKARRDAWRLKGLCSTCGAEKTMSHATCGDCRRFARMKHLDKTSQ